MAVDPHTAVAIAQIAFYLPLVPISILQLIRNWRYGPRTAWYPAVPFSIIRLTSGILTIIEKNTPLNRTLIIVTIVFLNVGLVPLLLSFFGLTRLVIESNLEHAQLKRYNKIMQIIKLNILGACALLSTSGGLAGKVQNASTQRTLSIISYIQFACLVVALIVINLRLYTGRGSSYKIPGGDIIYLQLALISSTFIVLRTIYGLLSVFEASGGNITTSIWSPLFGSAVAFALMALVPEYVALCLYLFLGRYRFRSCKAAETEGCEMS